MTLKDIEQIDREILTCEDVAELIGTNAQSLRSQAQASAEKLGFPVIVIGTRIRIPKDGFLYFMRYGRPVADNAYRI